MPTARLLVVEEAHLDGRRGVVVAPRFVWPGDEAPRSVAVRLVLPDGRERATRAEVQVAHVRGPHRPFALLRLMDLSPADVPAGTEIWAADLPA